jgi:hypothetical protein
MTGTEQAVLNNVAGAYERLRVKIARSDNYAVLKVVAAANAGRWGLKYIIVVSEATFPKVAATSESS